MNLSAKTVVVIAIGAALYGIGGLPMFGIPVFANTTLKPAMAVLALFSVLYGPIVGFLVGFIGHWVTDLFAGWGVWLTWVLGSGIVGMIIGLFPIITKNRIESGLFDKKDFLIFVVLAFFRQCVRLWYFCIFRYYFIRRTIYKSIYATVYYRSR